MQHDRKYFVFPFLFMLLCFFGCTKQETELVVSNPDAAYRFAWQYILSEIEQYDGFEINDAKITRFEQVSCFNEAYGKVYVYALEYAFFATWDYGWIPGGDGSGSTYLFIAEQDEDFSLLAAASAKNVFDNGGYAGLIQNLMQHNGGADYAKPSIGVNGDHQAEINEAICAAEEFFSMKDCLMINIWYDETVHSEYQTRFEEDVSTRKANTIVLCGDIYFWDNGMGQPGPLFHQANIVLTRETVNDAWVVATYGY